MILHFCTQEETSYFFDYSLSIMDDERFDSLILEDEIDDILNSEEIIDMISNSDLDDIIEAIDPLFDKTSNGMFDWKAKTEEYYELFENMLKELNCRFENEAGDIIKIYNCELSDEDYYFSDDILSVSLTGFNSGYGEPIGAQLALEMTEVFMKAGQWHVGFFDSNKNLVTNISSWAKEHILDIAIIKPIVWFGSQDDISECWSITPDTSDLFLNQFWREEDSDFLERASPYIFKADQDFYFSLGEYGLEYDLSIFEEIKSSCPINIELPDEDRANALLNLVISIYNDRKVEGFSV